MRTPPTSRPTSRPNGHYSANSAYFYTTPPMGTNPTITTVNSPPLQAPPNTNGTVNGVYSYAGTPTFPTSTFQCRELLGGPGLFPLKRRSGNRAGQLVTMARWWAPLRGRLRRAVIVV